MVQIEFSFVLWAKVYFIHKDDFNNLLFPLSKTSNRVADDKQIQYFMLLYSIRTHFEDTYYE